MLEKFSASFYRQRCGRCENFCVRMQSSVEMWEIRELKFKDARQGRNVGDAELKCKIARQCRDVGDSKVILFLPF